MVDDLANSLSASSYFILGLLFGTVYSSLTIITLYAIYKKLIAKLDLVNLSSNNTHDIVSRLDKSVVEVKNSITILSMKVDEGKKQNCCKPNQFIIPDTFAAPHKKKPGRPPKTIDVHS